MKELRHEFDALFLIMGGPFAVELSFISIFTSRLVSCAISSHLWTISSRTSYQAGESIRAGLDTKLEPGNVLVEDWLCSDHISQS